MDKSFNFLLHSLITVETNRYTEKELDLIYNFIIMVEYDLLIHYNLYCRVIQYDNDLQVYIDIVKKLINIFEEREEYEKCVLLKEKLDLSYKIIEKEKI